MRNRCTLCVRRLGCKSVCESLNVLHRHQSSWRSKVAHAVPVGPSDPVPHSALSITVHPQRPQQQRRGSYCESKSSPRLTETTTTILLPAHPPQTYARLPAWPLQYNAVSTLKDYARCSGCCCCVLEALQQHHLLDALTPRV